MKFSLSAGLKSILCALAVLAFQARLEAASYYVDYSAGHDTGAGTNTADPWKHCPGDPAATGVASNASLAPGDTVFFKCGVSYILTGASGIVMAWNGTAGQPITYDGGTWGSNGTNRANLRCNYDSSGTLIGTSLNAFQGNSAAISFVTMNSLDIGPIGGSLTLPRDNGTAVQAVYGGGIGFNASVASLTISNCYFHAIGYWFNQQPMSASSISGIGILLNGFTNVSIVNCEFTKMQIACEVGVGGACGNLNIGNCNFHDYIVWCVDLGLRNNGCTLENVFVHDNTFHDYCKQFGAGAWTGYGGYGSWPHCDGIFHRANATGLTSFKEGTNIDFYNNLFYDTPPLSGGATASIFLLGSVNENIYNNVFLSPSVANGAIATGGNTQTNIFASRIYNNTFYTQGQTAVNIGGPWAVVTSKTEVDVENNIFYDASAPSPDTYPVYFSLPDGSAVPNIFFDHNDYCTLNTRPAYMYWPQYGGHFSLDGSGTGVDNSLRRLLHWETNGIAAAPPFAVVKNTNYWASNDYHLTFTANVVSVGGTNLSYLKLPGLSSDIEGNARPSTGVWSMGAYQAGYTNKSSGGTSAGTSVTNADLQVINSANATAVATNQPVVFTIRLQNNGPSAVPANLGLTVTNKLPAAFAYISSSPSGAYNSSSGLWTVSGGLASGALTSLTITAAPTGAGTYTNYSSVAVPAGITDGTLANNTYFTVVTVTNQPAQAQIGSSGSGSGSGSTGGSGSGSTGGTTNLNATLPPPPTGVRVIYSGG